VEQVRELEESFQRGRTPSWLGGRFRPRNLSLDGQILLEHLDPAVVRKEGPILLLDGYDDWESLADRMTYLQEKYLLLDLVRKGHGVEADGRFWPAQLAKIAELTDLSAPRRRRESQAPQPPITIQETIGWLGAFRRASWDQMRSLHPRHREGMDHLLQHLMDCKLVQEERVAFGLGTLGTLSLTDRGVKELKSSPEGRDLVRRGFGTRGSGRGFGEFHEQGVGDAIGYCTQEVQVNGGEVLGITLEHGLRREYLGAEHIPDLRIEFKTDVGYYHWDVEVLGLGVDNRGYKSSAKIQAKLGSSATVRGFDPMGRSVAGRDKDVRVKR
jgi:hypothetical protein